MDKTKSSTKISSRKLWVGGKYETLNIMNSSLKRVFYDFQTFKTIWLRFEMCVDLNSLIKAENPRAKCVLLETAEEKKQTTLGAV